MNELLDQLRPIVCRWALVWTGSPDLAEDVAQAVLIAVHRSLPSYRAKSRVTTWVYRMTKNAVVDVERKAGRERARVEALTAEAMAVRVGHRPDALELLGAADQLGHFMKALSPQQRAIVDLVELQGFKSREVAEMLGIAAATVRVHLHRAKTAMAEVGRASQRAG